MKLFGDLCIIFLIQVNSLCHIMLLCHSGLYQSRLYCIMTIILTVPIDHLKHGSFFAITYFYEF